MTSTNDQPNGELDGMTVLIANPSADVYGADLQMLESVSALRERGSRVLVVLPSSGPLVALLLERGAEVQFVEFPVLRRGDSSPRGLVQLAWRSMRAMGRLRTTITSSRPDAVYVNTVTLPWWLLAARLARTPALCHVHEAEVRDPQLVRTALALPLALASTVVANSYTTLETMCAALPRLRARARVVHNGVAGPPHEPVAAAPGGPIHLLVVGRLSPRKAPDVALEALAKLRADRHDVNLELCGTPFAGYEWFEDALRARAERPDLAGSVTFSGYVAPLWPAFARSTVVVAPSSGESFGNAVVQAQLARRPVVASAVQGHLETVIDGVTGLLVPPGDADALAATVGRLIVDGALCSRLSEQGRRTAGERFSVRGYRVEISGVVRSLCDRPSPSGGLGWRQRGP